MFGSWYFTANSSWLSGEPIGTPPRAGVGVALPGRCRSGSRARAGSSPAGAPTIEYVRRVLAEVDARLLHVEQARRRQAALEERRLAARVRGVVVRRHDAEAVGVDDVVVGPVALAVGEAREVELAQPR